MRILVLSDSHTDVDTMDLVFSRVHPDMVIHLGDSVIDAVLLHSRHPDVPFEMVMGNTDKDSNRPEQNIIHIGPISALLTHGDTYQVENRLDLITKTGQEAGARLILYGHTHVPCIADVGGITIMNPGRIGRISSKIINASFGIIETGEADLSCSIFFVDGFGKSAYADSRFELGYTLN